MILQSLLPIVFLLAITVAADAQSYNIKLDRDWVKGGKFAIACRTETRMLRVISSGSRSLMDIDSTSETFLHADAEVLTTVPLGMRFRISRYVRFLRGDTIDILPPDTEVICLHSKEIRGVNREIPPDIERDLMKTIGGLGQDSDRNIGTNKPQSVGGTWPINGKAFAENMFSSGNAAVDATGTATLVSVAAKDSIPAYKVRTDIDMRISKFSGLESYQHQDVTAKAQLELDCPLDESMGVRRTKLHIVLNIDARATSIPDMPEGVTLKARMETVKTSEFTYK